MAQSEQRHAWVCVDLTPDGLSRDSRAALGLALGAGCRVTAVSSPCRMGACAADQAAALLAGTGVAELLVLRLPDSLADQPESLAEALALAASQAQEREVPTDILGIANAAGRDLLARVASALGAPLLQDCAALDLSKGEGEKYLLSGRSIGSYSQSAASGSALRCWSLRPNAVPAPVLTPSGLPVPLRVLDIPLSPPRVRVVGSGAPAAANGDACAALWAEQPDILEAATILSGGRSLENAENFCLLHAVARKIHAAVGASRSAVDLGYAPPAVQIGQTGVVVSPDCYIAFGISGSIFHLAGIRTARRVVAINNDTSSPIFARADYGLDADLFEVLPILERLVRDEA